MKLRLAEKTKAEKAEKAEKARKLQEAKERREIGTQQLIEWLSEIGQPQLLSTFQCEGFNSLMDVVNADLGQEDLAVLGITEPDKQQTALTMLAARHAALGETCAKQLAMGFAKLKKKRTPTLADVGFLSLARSSPSRSPSPPKPEPERE